MNGVENGPVLPGPEDLEGGLEGGQPAFDDYVDDTGEEPAAGSPDQPRRRRGRPPRERTEQAVASGSMPWQQPNLEFDDWMRAFPWDQDGLGLKVTLKRVAPTRWGGADISGVIEQRSGPIMLEEINDSYGGGEYEAVITGIHPKAKHNHAGTLARRRIKSGANGGKPLTHADAMPRSTIMEGGRGGFDGGGMAGMVAALRSNQQEPSRLVEKTIAVVQESANSRAEGAEAAARERVQLAEVQLKEERAKVKMLEERLHGLETDTMKMAAAHTEKLNEAVTSSNNNSLQALMTLLPSLTGSAGDQVKQMASFYEARETRASVEYKTSIQQMQANFNSQMDAQRTLFQAQTETLKGQFESTITLLKQELAISRANEAMLNRIIEQLRLVIEEKNKEIFARMSSEKSRSPMESFTEMGQMFEAMEGMRNFMSGGQAAAQDDMEGIESPVTRKLLRMGEGLMQHAPAIVNAFTNKGAAPAAGPAAGPAPVAGPVTGPAYPQQALPQPARRPSAAGPVAGPAPVEPSAAGGSTVRKPTKAEVSEALGFIGNVLRAGGENPTPVEDVARLAVMKADNAVLRSLTSRRPEKVIAVLEDQGMLEAPLSTPAGKKYLTDLLTALAVQLK